MSVHVCGREVCVFYSRGVRLLLDSSKIHVPDSEDPVWPPPPEGTAAAGPMPTGWPRTSCFNLASSACTCRLARRGSLLLLIRWSPSLKFPLGFLQSSYGTRDPVSFSHSLAGNSRPGGDPTLCWLSLGSIFLVCCFF